MEFTAQNAEYAVSVFYNGEQNDRSKAHTWLTTAQRVPEAWNFLWELLQPSKGTEVQFYGATTLHTKILRCWNEVPPESYEELKDKLLQAVFTYSKGPKIVTNRLCIGLAAFILQQGTVDLATILRPLSDVENTMLLLEVLTVIPEEYNSMTMGSSLRAKNRAMLRQACPAVLDDMLRYLQTVYNDFSKEPPPEQMVQSWTIAASCASSWLSIDGVEAEIGPALPERMPLFRALLTAVHVLYSSYEMVSDSALDACEACLSAARACGDAGSAARFPATALELLASLAALTAPIMQRDSQPNSANEELLSALMTCCVALGVTHARVIVDAVESGEESAHAAGARQLLELLLEAQGAPGHYPIHETRSNLIFGFWYTLQDEILNVMEQKITLNSVWREVFSRLLTVLVAKSEAAADATMSKDDIELLRCYRQDIADTLMYCFAIVGEWCWSRVEAAYAGAATEARREAALHVFCALADAAPHRQAPAALLALLRHALHQVNTSTHARTLTTALDSLGSYAAWLSSIEEINPAYSELACECMVAAGGALSRRAAPAALALRKLAADCPGPAASLATHLVHTAQNSAGLEAWTRRQLIGAAGAALAGADAALAGTLLQGLAETLHKDLLQQAAEPAANGGAAECVASLLASLAARPELAADLYRSIANTLPPFAVHPALVESMFSILKQTVSALMGDVLPLLEQIAQLTVAGCSHQPCASGLDVVKLIVIVAGSEWEGSREFLRACVSGAARALAPAAGARPDLAEGLFALLLALTKKKPLCLDWIDDLLPDLVDLGCTCIRLWEAGAARSACWWLAALCGARPAALQHAAPALVHSALRCIGGATPRNQIEPLAELLLALNRAAWRGAGDCGGALAGWLRAALAAPAFPTPHATDAHKHKFIAAVIKEKSSKRRLLDTVQEFSLVCRGLVGTEYARQSIAAKQLVA